MLIISPILLICLFRLIRMNLIGFIQISLRKSKMQSSISLRGQNKLLGEDHPHPIVVSHQAEVGDLENQLCNNKNLRKESALQKSKESQLGTFMINAIPSKLVLTDLGNTSSICLFLKRKKKF